MKKKYVTPEMMKISVNSNEAFSAYSGNCLPYMWGGELEGQCESVTGIAMSGFSYAECVEVGYPT